MRSAERADAAVRGRTTLPTFVVIGAAKAGTTALYWYLAEHPQVAMSALKETNFFAYGVDELGRPLYGNPELHHFPVRTLEEYERQFAHAGDAVAVGEASPIYLECPQAAARIAELLPDARIVCGLREPVDRAYSDYQMYLRSRGRRLVPERDLSPDAEWARPGSHWMTIGRYHEALSRYFDAFPRERIHVFLFDDLKANAAGVVRDLYAFLGVDPAFVPDLETPHNVGGMPTSMLVERILTSHTLRALAEPLIPKRTIDRFRRARTRNLRRAPALPTDLHRELLQHFAEDIVRTSELIGRSLEHWLNGIDRQSALTSHGPDGGPLGFPDDEGVRS